MELVSFVSSFFFQGSGGGATGWATAPGTPVNSDSATVTMPEDAAAEETNNPTSESDSETKLNVSAAPFTPAARPGPRKPPRRHGA